MKQILFAAGTRLGIAVCLMLSAGAQAAGEDAVDDGFVRLSGGTFNMGSPASEAYRHPDETRHQVTLSPFYVDPYEVAQEDYEELMGQNPSANRGYGLPVENVTWLDAVRYCNALSRERGLQEAYVIDGESVSWLRSANGYRLLTEAEWEYAARAGSETVFDSGDFISVADYNFHGSYPYLIETNYVRSTNPNVKTGLNRGQTVEVDELPPNAFGLCSLLGNVSEWVFDYYGEYPADGAADPAGPSEGTYRVSRGGSYNDFAKHLRAAQRSAVNPLDADRKRGFRVARNAVEGQGTFAAAAPRRLSVSADPKVALAYFSYSGNVRNGAGIIGRKLGVTPVEIELETPYSGESNIYEVTGRETEANARPAVRTRLEDLSSADVLLLGYPLWWNTMPMAVFTFVESHDLKDKIILPFSSFGSTVWGEGLSDLAKTAAGAYVGLGYAYRYSGPGDLEAQIEDWLKGNGLLK